MKTDQELSPYLAAFRSHSCEPPAGYICAARRGLIGFEEFSLCEPWYFCSPAEILPLDKRWPGFKADCKFLPFARRQDRDELACFKIEGNKVFGCSIVSYNLGPPLSWEISEEYATFWDWVRGIIKDVEMWCDETEQQ